MSLKTKFKRWSKKTAEKAVNSMFSSSKTIIVNRQAISIEPGRKLVISVWGECYGQNSTQRLIKELYKKSGGKNMTFSLAPPADYQIRQKWPEGVFLNVIRAGEKECTRENWLGWFAPEHPEYNSEDYSDDGQKQHDERAGYIKKLVDLCKIRRVDVQGKILHEDRTSYDILIFCSRTSIDEAHKKYISS